MLGDPVHFSANFNSQKFISRKISATEKFFDFHTVFHNILKSSQHFFYQIKLKNGFTKFFPMRVNVSFFHTDLTYSHFHWPISIVLLDQPWSSPGLYQQPSWTVHQVQDWIPNCLHILKILYQCVGLPSLQLNFGWFFHQFHLKSKFYIQKHS